MIHAFNFCGKRDRQLMRLMLSTLEKYAENYLASFKSFDMDKAGYGNGAGWDASMLKLKAMRQIVSNRNFRDDDWVLSIDSDVVFCNSDLFVYLKTIDSLIYDNFGIAGIHQVGKLAKCKMGELHNFSGCSIYIKGHIAKKIAELSEDRLKEVREDFRAYVITENEDVVLSYLAQMCGAEPLPLPDCFFHSDFGFEYDIGMNGMKSFYHLNYPLKIFKDGKFLGEEISGKWDIPKVLRKKGIKL